MSDYTEGTPIWRNLFQYYLFIFLSFCHVNSSKSGCCCEGHIWGKRLHQVLSLQIHWRWTIVSSKWPNDVTLLSFYWLLMTIKVSESHLAGERETLWIGIAPVWGNFNWLICSQLSAPQVVCQALLLCLLCNPFQGAKSTPQHAAGSLLFYTSLFMFLCPRWWGTEAGSLGRTGHLLQGQTVLIFEEGSSERDAVQIETLMIPLNLAPQPSLE